MHLKMWRILGFLLLCILLAEATGGSECDAEYGYNSTNGPSNWHLLCKEWYMCKEGKAQSPINIDIVKANISNDLPLLNTSSYVEAPGTLVNGGHDLEINVPFKEAGHILVNGEVYYLYNYHFHSPSEHVVQKTRFPLEMHMVHKSASGNLTVLGILFHLGKANPFLDQFWSYIRQIPNEGSSMSIGNISPHPNLHLGPVYARYNGSLTTPACDEGVIWTVFLWRWNTVSEEQLHTLRKIFPEHTNRPTQKLNGRNVELFLPQV